MYAGLCVYRCVKAPLDGEEGGETEEEKKEARPKVKPNSFSVRLEAADLSAVPYHESLFQGLPHSACLHFLSLCIYYISERAYVMYSCNFIPNGIFLVSSRNRETPN